MARWERRRIDPDTLPPALRPYCAASTAGWYDLIRRRDRPDYRRRGHRRKLRYVMRRR